jgi:hypothetical protein
MDGELWHIVEARRDDGTPTMFRIRELEPKKALTRIFVVELPYPTMELSRLPTADAYRRLGELEEQWLRPACTSLGWEIVGSKTEDGSFFLYMYGASDPDALVERISPFDAELGFYDDEDPDWLEYATLRELLDQAKAMPQVDTIPELTGRVPAAKLKTNGTHVAPPLKKAATLKQTAALKKTAPLKRSAAKKSAAGKPVAKKPATKKAMAKKAAPAKKAKPASKKATGVTKKATAVSKKATAVSKKTKVRAAAAKATSKRRG